jgi:hypothetical protein
MNLVNTTGNQSASPVQASLLTDAVVAVLNAFPATVIGIYSSIDDLVARSIFERMGGATDHHAWQRNMLVGIATMSSRTNFRSFVAEGQGHCAMSFDNARRQTGFDEFLAAVLEGNASSSENCGAACELAGISGCDGVVGSALVEDRCGVCDGDGSSCPPRISQLCSCASVPAPRCSSSSLDASDNRWPRPTGNETEQAPGAEGPSAGDIAVWILLGSLGIMGVVLTIHPGKMFADGPNHVERESFKGQISEISTCKATFVLARKNLQIKRAQYCSLSCGCCPCTILCELLFPVSVILVFGLLRNLNAAETSLGGWEVVVRTRDFLDPIRVNVPMD